MTRLADDSFRMGCLKASWLMPNHAWSEAREREVERDGARWS